MTWQPVKIVTDQSATVFTKGPDYATPLVVGIGDAEGTDLAPVKISSVAAASEQFGENSVLTKYLTIMFANGMNTCYALDIHDTDNLAAGLETTKKLPVRILVPVGLVETEENTFISTTIFSHIKAIEKNNPRVCMFSLGKGEVFGDTTNAPPTTLTALIGQPGANKMIAFSSMYDDEIAPAIAAIRARRPAQMGPVGQPVQGMGTVPVADYTDAQMEIAKENKCNLVTTDTSMINRVSTMSFFTMGDPNTGRHKGSLEFVFMELEGRLMRAYGAPEVIDSIQITESGMSQLNQIGKDQLMICASQKIIGPVLDNAITNIVQDALRVPKDQRDPAQQEIIDIATTTNNVDLIIRFTHLENVYTIFINPLTAQSI